MIAWHPWRARFDLGSRNPLKSCVLTYQNHAAQRCKTWCCTMIWHLPHHVQGPFGTPFHHQFLISCSFFIHAALTSAWKVQGKVFQLSVLMRTFQVARLENTEEDHYTEVGNTVWLNPRRQCLANPHRIVQPQHSSNSLHSKRQQLPLLFCSCALYTVHHGKTSST